MVDFATDADKKNVKVNLVKYHLAVTTQSMGLRINRLYPLQRDKNSPHKKWYPGYGAKLHLMLWLQLWRPM